jgi:formate-dependent nitrite reductase membrane component NrfD
MKPEKAWKMEKITGYTLLVFGLVLIIIPVILALLVFLSAIAAPQLIPKLTSEDDFAQSFAEFSNACLVFFLLLTMVWAGSIVTSRGVTMIKDVRLKLARKSLKEVAETVEKVEDASE